MISTNGQNLISDQQRKPIQLNEINELISKSIDKLPPININHNNEAKTVDTKKTFKWKFWWEKNDSNLRIPIFDSPGKVFENVPPKVSSLDFVNHKPGGGNVKVINNKPQWKKEAKIQNQNINYKPKGGQVKILNEKVHWNAESKIGSFDFISHKPTGGTVKIIEQPFRKSGIRSKIDTGLILEEVEVPYDFETTSPRLNTRSTNRSTTQLNHMKDSINKDLNTTRSFLKNL